MKKTNRVVTSRDHRHRSVLISNVTYALEWLSHWRLGRILESRRALAGHLTCVSNQLSDFRVKENFLQVLWRVSLVLYLVIKG